MIPGLFLYYENALDDGNRRGGVQICTHEFKAILEAAGFKLQFVKIHNDMRLLNRLRRKFFVRPYHYNFEEKEILNCVKKYVNSGVRFVFLNQAVLRPLAITLRRTFNNSVKIILLSHGLPSIDEFHRIEINDGINRLSLFRGLNVIRMFLEEGKHGTYFDFVFSLSPLDQAFEKWRCASNVIWLPRIINGKALNWRPCIGRYGFVGTLDHPPNYEGLRLLLDVLKTRTDDSIEIRVVGGPSKVGNNLTRSYPFVSYLGPLTDQELEHEASTWNAFLHPIFRWSMGASMKLSVAIAWEIPVITTSAGCRGYVFRKGKMIIADDPNSFVDLMFMIKDKDKAYKAKEQIINIKLNSPSLEEISSIIKETLGV